VEGDFGVTPNPTMARPMKQSPNTRIFFLPIFVITLPTMGDPIMTATEYIQNIYPMIDTSIPQLFNSSGRKGTTSEYQLLERMFEITSATTSQ